MTCPFYVGRLWIHAASKIPEPDTVKAMEDFYREIYATDGVTDLKFPEHYPTSRLLGLILDFLKIGDIRFIIAIIYCDNPN